MNRKIVDAIGFVSLGLSVWTVVYMLMLEKVAWMGTFLMVAGVALGILVLLTMVPRKCHLAFLEICREKPCLLPARLVASVLLFILGWYLGSAMPQVFGADSPAVLGNANVMLCPLFSMFGHVIALGCVKKAKNL